MTYLVCTMRNVGLSHTIKARIIGQIKWGNITCQNLLHGISDRIGNCHNYLLYGMPFGGQPLTCPCQVSTSQNSFWRQQQPSCMPSQWHVNKTICTEWKLAEPDTRYKVANTRENSRYSPQARPSHHHLIRLQCQTTAGLPYTFMCYLSLHET